MDRPRRERGELGDVTADVVAGGVEAHRLAHGVEDPVRPRVRPVPATHCQLPELLATSPSTSSSAKWAAPRRQSRRRSLTRKDAARSRARPGIHPSRAELAHRRVDDRVSGEAVAPGCEGFLVLVPLVAARPVVGVRQVRSCGQELEIEVPPAELTQERLGAHVSGDAVRPARPPRRSRSGGRARVARSIPARVGCVCPRRRQGRSRRSGSDEDVRPTPRREDDRAKRRRGRALTSSAAFPVPLRAAAGTRA